MNRRHWMLAGIVVAVTAIMCAMSYADKADKIELPAAVKAAIDEIYPGAKISEVEQDTECIKVYEVEVVLDGKEYTMTITPDGTVMEIESELALDEMPEAVKAALAKAAPGGEIKEAVEEATLWIVTLKRLQTPELSYEAEVVANGVKTEIKVAADGKIIEQQNVDEDDDNDRDDDEDD